MIDLPTNKDHFYEVHRIELDTDIELNTKNCFYVMMLVEGEAILVETADSTKQTFVYAETFVIPAAVKFYKLTNHSNGR